MKVDAVSSVGFKNNYTFGMKERRDELGAVVDYTPSSSPSLMKKVPVIVLLAMNPATLNSAIPMMPETDNPNQIVTLAPETKSADAPAYVISPIVEELQQDDAPFGWAYLGKPGIKIQQVINGKNKLSSYNMIYIKYNQLGKENDVKDVFLVSDDEKTSSDKLLHPPEIVKLIYHNIGEDKEFCGAVVHQFDLDSNGSSKGMYYREIRLDRNTAQSLINLVTGHTKWNYTGPIELEETSSPKVLY